MASGASSRRTSLASLAESVEFPGERSEDDGEMLLIFVLINLIPQVYVYSSMLLDTHELSSLTRILNFSNRST